MLAGLVAANKSALLVAFSVISGGGSIDGAGAISDSAGIANPGKFIQNEFARRSMSDSSFPTFRKTRKTRLQYGAISSEKRPLLLRRSDFLRETAKCSLQCIPQRSEDVRSPAVCIAI
jgi:hypothetical protein